MEQGGDLTKAIVLGVEYQWDAPNLKSGNRNVGKFDWKAEKFSDGKTFEELQTFIEKEMEAQEEK